MEGISLSLPVIAMDGAVLYDIQEKKYLRFYMTSYSKTLELQLKILCYPSADYSGYSYLKIYNKNAEKDNMIKYLQTTLHCAQTITFGSMKGKYDYISPSISASQSKNQK